MLAPLLRGVGALPLRRRSGLREFSPGLLTTVALAAAAAGEVAASPTLEALTRASEIVVHARVSGVRAAWFGPRIFTFARLEPVRLWRGRLPPGAEVITSGGVVGELAQRVDGAATFEAGEEVVLFLTAAEAGAYRVTGLARGKWVVDAAGRVAGPASSPVEVHEFEARVRAVR
jgi:hypothetical protein